jgi:hypothetical protein
MAADGGAVRYLLGTDDKAIPPAAQRFMAAARAGVGAPS